MNEPMRHFKFSMTEPETGSEFTFEETIPDHDPKDEEELDYLLTQFKNFLKAAGFTEMTISRIQHLEDDEWKYVLEKYGDWDSYKESLYEAWKGRKYDITRN